MIPTVSWQQFLSEFRWNQGEHLSAIAPTKGGKTTLFKNLMPYRKYNIMFGTKPDDPLYHDIIRKRGFERIESITDVKPWQNNYLLWPKQRKTIPETMVAQRKAFGEALDVIVNQKAWTVWMDETKYMSQMLKLSTQITYCLEQLRSINATVICGAQRPSWMPPSVLSNSTHIFIAKSTNRDDAIKLADIGGIDARQVRDEARGLGEYEFIYIKSRGTDTQIVRTKVQEK